MANYYLGVVVDIYEDDTISKEYHVAIVDIPSLGRGMKAFPKSGCLDEPKKGDAVLCLDLDPLYHSYLIYEKIKEDGIIGFRSSGKEVSITPDSITIGVYQEDGNERGDGNSDKMPEPKVSSIVMDSEGNITIESSGTVIINNGNNEGLVNIKALRKFMNCVLKDLVKTKSLGAETLAAWGEIMSELEDTNVIH